LASLGIIAVDLMSLANPRFAPHSFGLPLPEAAMNVEWWWLRLKGVRDVASGLVMLASMVPGAPRLLGIVLLIKAMIPPGDMAPILAAHGSTGRALGIHGTRALPMLAAAIPLIAGVDGCRHTPQARATLV
jgi:hypothetical protein